RDGDPARPGEIGVTQSALSQQLLDLEQRLGEPLFDRTARRMVPTAFGERFLEKARLVLDEAARMDAWLAGRTLGETIPLRVSTDNLLTLRWLPQVLARFRQLHPDVGLRILRTPDPLRELGKLCTGSRAGADGELSHEEKSCERGVGLSIIAREVRGTG